MPKDAIELVRAILITARENIPGALISAYLIIFFYPIAQSSLTCSVYLTVLVALHRYVAICHPFSAVN